MSKEAENDWGAYSGGKLIDATLYNIRRERRCEFMADGLRYMDLCRWRAMDQLIEQPYIPEGSIYGTLLCRLGMQICYMMDQTLPMFLHLMSANTCALTRRILNRPVIMVLLGVWLIIYIPLWSSSF